MSDLPDAKITSMKIALLESHKLLSSPVRQVPKRPRTPSRSTEIAKASTPSTPRSPSTIATPSAPRKRPVLEYDFFESTGSPKRPRAMPSIPSSTPTKLHPGRKAILQLDKVVCIPMLVLRAQRDDASALLRPLPRPSDRMRKLVDLSIQRSITKLKEPGAKEIIECALWVSGRNEDAKTEGLPVRKNARDKRKRDAATECSSST